MSPPAGGALGMADGFVKSNANLVSISLFDDELLPPGEGEGRQLPSLPVVNWLLRPLIAPSPRELGKWAAIFGGV
jgi:hypothetical protein